MFEKANNVTQSYAKQPLRIQGKNSTMGESATYCKIKTNEIAACRGRAGIVEASQGQVSGHFHPTIKPVDSA